MQTHAVCRGAFSARDWMKGLLDGGSSCRPGRPSGNGVDSYELLLASAPAAARRSAMSAAASASLSS